MAKKSDQLEYGDGISIAKSVVLQRSISLPVQTCLSHEWPEFMRIVHNAWQQSTALANWASHTLTLHDVVRLPSMKELPKYENVDLYALAFGREQERQGRQLWQCSACKKRWFPSKTDNGLAPSHKNGKNECEGSGKQTIPLERTVLPVVTGQLNGDDWQGAKSCAASLIQKVQKKYLRDRAQRIWLRKRRSPEFTYPYPFPVHQDSWVAMFGEHGELIVNLQMPGGRVSLRLRSGDQFRPQLRVLAGIINGDIKQQGLEVDAQLSHGSNGKQVNGRKPGGGQRQSFRVMLRISYPLEIYAGSKEGTATLTTGVDPFLTLQIADKPFASVWHCPWVTNWIIEHRKFLDDFSDDLKFEKRWPSKKRRSLNRYRERRCEKHDRRMKSWRQQTVHQVAVMLSRNDVSELVYDDSNRDFMEEFPWYNFKTDLENKCAEFGIVVRASASGEAMDENLDTVPIKDN